MMRKIILLLLCWLCVGYAKATHIVGGELEMRHVTLNQYRFSLILYFDGVNGNPAAIDRPTIRVHVFSKGDNRFVQSYDLPLTSDVLVPYTNPACAIGGLVTRRIMYSAVFNLDPNRFTNPQGYYMVWERCCRNGVIDNIIAPGDAGQTFYLEFPPLIVRGSRFLNSSPQLFPPLSDYACVNQPFYFNFAGTDPDGDKLVYSLVTPLSGTSSKDAPLPGIPAPAPYPLVRWTPGLSQTNMVPGNPTLRISPAGMLTVRASQVGLYVFAVLCEEFRNGVKIGEVRRDFQMLVIDCKVSNPPLARLQLPTGGIYNELDTIKFRLGDNKCMDLNVTDPDPNTFITTRILPLNFSNAGGIVQGGSGRINGPGDVLKIRLCFPECPSLSPAGYLMDIVVGDNSCSVPLLDTVRVYIKVIPEPNTPPAIRTSLQFNPATNEYETEFKVGETLRFDVFGNDVNLDTVTLRAQGLTAGMVFNTITGKPELRQRFSWTPACNVLQRTEASRDFVVNFEVADKRRCDPSKIETTRVRIKLRNNVTVNNRPRTSTTFPLNAMRQLYVDTFYVGQPIAFEVKGTDIDKDTIAITAQGVGFDMAGLGATFSNPKGAPDQVGKFTWTPKCNAVGPADVNGKEYNFNFITADFAPCRASDYDTLRVRMVIKNRPNLKPSILTSLRYDPVKKVYYDTVVVGRELRFTVTGDDPEKDTITLAMQGLGFDPARFAMQFTAVTGKAPQTGQFRWRTNCAMLPDTTRGRVFELNMLVNDKDACGIRKYDTVRVVLTLMPETRPNARPVISSRLRYNEQFRMYIDTVDVGTTVRFDMLGNDVDQDTLILRGSGVGFRFRDYNMSFRDVTGLPELRAPFEWLTDCSLLDIRKGQFQREFLINFTVTDVKGCQRPAFDTTRVKLVVVYRSLPNRAPVLSADQLQQTAPKTYFREVVAGTAISFNAVTTDEDRDSVLITAYGVGFRLADAGITFTSVKGIAPVQAPVRWQTGCQLLQNGKDAKDYEMIIVTRDFKGCASTRYDSVRVRLRVLPPPNPAAPTLRADLGYDANRQEYFRQIVPGELVSFNLFGDDADKNQIRITGVGDGFNMADFNMKFTEVSGIAPQSGKFEWQTACEMYRSRQEYVLTFTITDTNPCNLTKSNTIRVRLLMKDIVNTAEFIPYNAFTPNGDPLNDTFRLPNLPLDNCDDRFVGIEIYNRWGKLVFKSEDRNFAWDGKGFPSGMYYYKIIYQNSQYKGNVSLLGI